MQQGRRPASKDWGWLLRLQGEQSGGGQGARRDVPAESVLGQARGPTVCATRSGPAG